jgi:hypothetical protein
MAISLPVPAPTAAPRAAPPAAAAHIEKKKKKEAEAAADVNVLPCRQLRRSSCLRALRGANGRRGRQRTEGNAGAVRDSATDDGSGHAAHHASHHATDHHVLRSVRVTGLSEAVKINKQTNNKEINKSIE